MHVDIEPQAGSWYAWVYVNVLRCSPDGVLVQAVLFPDDQWSEALALFDERSASS